MSLQTLEAPEPRKANFTGQDCRWAAKKRIIWRSLRPILLLLPLAVRAKEDGQAEGHKLHAENPRAGWMNEQKKPVEQQTYRNSQVES